VSVSLCVCEGETESERDKVLSGVQSSHGVHLSDPTLCTSFRRPLASCSTPAFSYQTYILHIYVSFHT